MLMGGAQWRRRLLSPLQKVETGLRHDFDEPLLLSNLGIRAETFLEQHDFSSWKFDWTSLSVENL